MTVSCHEVSDMLRHRAAFEASHKAKGKLKPEASPVQAQAERTLTPDDLRTFANSMAANDGGPDHFGSLAPRCAISFRNNKKPRRASGDV